MSNKPYGWIAKYWKRMAALFFIVALCAGIIVFALDGQDSGYYSDGYYGNEYGEGRQVYIDIDNYGNVDISLSYYYYEIDRYDDVIIITLRQNRDDIVLNLPWGWTYVFLDEEYDDEYSKEMNEAYNPEAYDADMYRDEVYGIETYGVDAASYSSSSGNGYEVELSHDNASGFGDGSGFDLGDIPNYHGYLTDAPSFGDSYNEGDTQNDEEDYEDSYRDELTIIVVTPFSEDDVYYYDLGGELGDYGGHLGYAPTYGIVPLGGPFTVTFNSNGGYSMPIGHGTRTTIANGTVGPGNMPTAPQWPGGGRAVIGWNFANDYSGAMFDHNTVVDQDVTVFAVWGFLVHFSGNGALLHEYAANPISPNYPNPGFPDRLTCYSTRGIPVSTVNWSFDFTPWVVFPNPPVRPGWSFQGWFDTPSPSGGTQFHSHTQVTAETVLSARWELVRWLVTFDVQPGGNLRPGWAGNPQRNYRWALDTLSVRESTTDVVFSSFAPLPPEYRQNQFRPHNPTAPREHLEHTPYFSGSGTTIINPVPNINQLADTAWPMSAPQVSWTDTWTPPTAAGHPAHQVVPRRAITGWWYAPGGWSDNWLAPAPPTSFMVTTIPPTPPPLNNERWALPGASNVPGSTSISANHGWAYRPVTQDITVYANYVYRITFDPNMGSAGDQQIVTGSWTTLFPGTSTVNNFRDVLPGGPRTINNDGRWALLGDVQVQLQNVWSLHTWAYAGMTIPAGMPPAGSMTRVGHEFNGWWCTQLNASSSVNFPIEQGATQFTGDSVINCPCPGTSVDECANFPWKGGSRSVWAHWRVLPIVGSTIVFDLNVAQTGEFSHGQAFWPTFRPDNLQGVPTDRYFLHREPIAAFGITGWYSETPDNNSNIARMTPWHTGLSVHHIVGANVHYDDRLAMQLTRHYVAGRSVNSTEASNTRMPRNPMRVGYIFMGWYDNPQGTGPRFTGNEVLNPGTRTLYAQWAPAFDLIFNYNDGTNRELVRTMAIGHNLGGWDGDENSMRASGRWNNDNMASAAGQSHIWNQYDMSSAGNALAWTRPVGWVTIPSVASSFNFYQNPDNTNHFQFTTALNVTQAILDQYGGVANGRPYVRIYQQWGITLTFDNNLAMIGSGLFTANRPATIAYGQSVNMSLNAATRHPHLPNRENVFSPWVAVSPWLGTTGVHGTVGGWPVNTPATPVGGHWPQIFQLAGPAWNLLEWNTASNGTGTEVTADTTYYEPTTIHAIWGQYLVFHPGMAGVEAQNMPSPLRRPVNVTPPTLLPNFPATPPTWDGRIFRGWHAWGDPSAPQLTATTPVAVARTYHAMWYAYVVWHPALTANSGANIPGYAVNTPTTARRLIIGTPFGPVGPDDPIRPGGWVLGRDSLTNAVNWFAIDASAPNGRRMYTSIAPPIMQATHLYPEWLGHVNFRPNGGLINNSTATVTRIVPEGLTLAVNPAAERAPTNVTRTNAIFAGWRQVHENGTPLVAGSAPLTAAQVEAIAVNSAHLWFEAVWSLDFEFFKSDMSVYSSTPATFNRRQGATFVLERPDSSGGWNTVFTSTSDANGRVAMTGPHSALAEIPSTSVAAVNFRLRETVAPTGYVIPASHWYMAIGGSGGLVLPVPATVVSPAQPNLDFVVVAYTDVAGDMRDLWVVGNRPVTFTFYKVNQQNQPLSGAEFQLYIYNGGGTPPLGLISTTDISSTWSPVPIESSTATSVTFPMIPGRHYQLIETAPPTGHQLPMGQWRISVTNPAAPANPALTVTAVGGVPMPPIAPGSAAGTYMVVNWSNITLPMAGGLGMRLFMVAGSSALLISIGGVAYIFLRKRNSIRIDG